MHCIWSGVTHLGRYRGRNEDVLLIFNSENNDTSTSGSDETNDNHILLGVCDGVGGAKAGEVAAEIAAEETIRMISEQSRSLTNNSDIKSSLHQILTHVNEKILNAEKLIPKWKGLGTTLSLMVITNQSAIIGHIGDSRIYRLRKKKLEQLTDDHTVAWDLWKQGKITDQERDTHPKRHILEQVMGGSDDSILHPQITAFNIHSNDIFLVCSDGLSDGLSDEIIQKHLTPTKHNKDSLDESLSNLLDDCLENYGKDNISMVLASFTSAGAISKLFGKK